MFRPQVLWTAALIATGSVGGVIYNWPFATDQETVVEDQIEVQTDVDSTDHGRGFSLMQNAADLAPRVEPIELDALRIGDRLVSGGNFIGAYKHYLKLQRQSDTAEDGSLAVRLGLASELAGFLEQAEDHYRTAIQSTSSSLLQQLWGLVGTARVWEAQGRLDEAISLLSELYLVYGNEPYPVEIRVPIHKGLTDCLQKRYLASVNNASHPVVSAIQYYWTAARIEPVISDSVQLPPQSPDQADTTKLTVIQNPINDVGLILVDIKTPFHPVPMLVSELGQALKMEFQISSRARSVLTGRSIRIAAKALPVSVLLDQALGSLALAWRQSDGVVFVAHYGELTSKQKDSYEIERIQRLLHQRELNISDAEGQAPALMQDGNNRLLLADYETAANKFKSARDLRPGGELSAMLYFNSGILELMRGDKDAALSKFYQSLDQTLSPQLQSASYVRIAELELAFGRPEKAIPAAARGRRLSRDPDTAAQNLMLLAKSYLLESDPFSANQVLFDNSTSISDPKSRRMASVISSYARFQVVKPLGGLQNEGERLVVSLAALMPDDPKGFVDHLVVSRAFRDVGFRTKAIEHLEIAAQTVSGDYWEQRIKLELAEILYAARDLEKSGEVLNSIVQIPTESMFVTMTLLQARISLELERHEECQALCQTLLEQPLDEQTKKEALEILGSAYQQTGKHYSAALCFAGLLPELVKPTIAVPTNSGRRAP